MSTRQAYSFAKILKILNYDADNDSSLQLLTIAGHLFVYKRMLQLEKQDNHNLCFMPFHAWRRQHVAFCKL